MDCIIYYCVNSKIHVFDSVNTSNISTVYFQYRVDFFLIFFYWDFFFLIIIGSSNIRLRTDKEIAIADIPIFRFDEFTSLMLSVFHKLSESGDFRNQLLLMRSLTILQVYPERELLEIFSIDYIERLDKTMDR